MASQDLKQRTSSKDDTAAEMASNSKSNNATVERPRRDKKMAMARRGLKSLAVAIALPLSVTLSAVLLSGSAASSYRALRKPFWLPPVWALHLCSLGSSLLMGLSAWLVWAEGGFHRNATALLFYLGQMVLGVVWEPIAIAAGACRVGLVLSVAMFGALAGCSRIFRGVNPIAGSLVKPCLAWAAFLVIVNLKLLYL